MIGKILFYFLLATVSLTLSAGTSVWKVNSGSSMLYLGGTFHLLRESDFPLPPEFDAAYQESSSLVFETDLGKMQDPAVQQLMMSQGMLDGKSLSDLLSPTTYQLLSDYCDEVGLTLDALNGFKPSIVLLTIALMELQTLGISEEGVDMHFYLKAKRDGKATGELESLEAQIAFICSMGEGNEEEFVLHSMRDMESTLDELPRLLKDWRSGNREGMRKGFVDPMERDFPALYKSLILDRNLSWMPQIKSLLKSKETEFVLVGAAHLVGEDGILTALEKLGYHIEKLDL